MRDVILFCEESFHEKFVGALLRRFEEERQIAVSPRFLSSQGGLPRMHSEFRDFLRDLARDRQSLPDAVIVVADANCEGYNARRDLMYDGLHRYPQFEQLVSYAIPDPHIERWMLADPRAFQAVFGRGCTTPAVKCAKDEYKRQLRKEIRDSGIEAPLGGQEFAEDIVMAMDLGHVEKHEDSLGRFLQDLKGLFNAWRDR
ncbi:MAG: DUF4276 family protein [Bryobacteraceae bacterium]|nr:DUF4276 family protein [Bryobacteraceae bacterium]